MNIFPWAVNQLMKISFISIHNFILVGYRPNVIFSGMIIYPVSFSDILKNQIHLQCMETDQQKCYLNNLGFP